MTAAAEQLLDELLPRFCEACGEGLPAPGEQCGTCAALPSLTRAEAAERLAQPGAVAMIRAARLREEVQREHERLRGLLYEADMVEHVARLEAERDEAAAELVPLEAEVRRLARQLKKAQEVQEKAGRAEEDARTNYTAADDAVKAARRRHQSAAVKTEALKTLQAAAPVLEDEQAALRAATAAREKAGRELTAALGQVDQAKAKRDARNKAVDEPGRAPRSVITLALDLAHQAQLADLTEPERIWLRSYGAAVAALSGAGEDIAARAVELHDLAHEEAARNRRVFTTPAGDGLVSAWVNPLATRQQP